MGTPSTFSDEFVTRYLRKIATDGLHPPIQHSEHQYEVVLCRGCLNEVLKNPEPIPMILHCPICCARHIDEDEFGSKPHHTHACQQCGFVWRPSIVATVGVKFLPGFKNET